MNYPAVPHCVKVVKKPHRYGGALRRDRTSDQTCLRGRGEPAESQSIESYNSNESLLFFQPFPLTINIYLEEYNFTLNLELNE